KPDVIEAQVLDTALWKAPHKDTRLTSGHNLREPDVFDLSNFYSFEAWSGRNVNRLAMPPPMPSVQAGFDRNIGKHGILNVSIIPGKKTNPTIRAINHQVLEHQIAHRIVAITNP